MRRAVTTAVLVLLMGLSGCAAGSRWLVLKRIGLAAQPYRVVAPIEAPTCCPDHALPLWIARGPQPDPEDIAALKEAGFRTILNLRGPSPHRSWFREEEKACGDHGLQLISLRISSHRGPDDETLEELARVLGDPSLYPMMIHCAGGVHRTGFAVATYRILYQGWTAEEAIEEMYDNGFRFQGKERGALLTRVRDLETLDLPAAPDEPAEPAREPDPER